MCSASYFCLVFVFCLAVAPVLWSMQLSLRPQSPLLRSDMLILVMIVVMLMLFVLGARLLSSGRPWSCGIECPVTSFLASAAPALQGYDRASCSVEILAQLMLAMGFPGFVLFFSLLPAFSLLWLPLQPLRFGALSIFPPFFFQANCKCLMKGPSWLIHTNVQLTIMMTFQEGGPIPRRVCTWGFRSK